MNKYIQPIIRIKNAIFVWHYFFVEFSVNAFRVNMRQSFMKSLDDIINDGLLWASHFNSLQFFETYNGAPTKFIDMMDDFFGRNKRFLRFNADYLRLMDVDLVILLKCHTKNVIC